jgi:hypothetical protein
MVMVIFGAGASFDSVPHRPPGTTFSGREYRPPLANELFGDRPQFASAMEQFPKCLALIPHLRKAGISVEEELEKLQTEAEEDPERHRQLAAIRYYLHFLLTDCVQIWTRTVARGVTNYRTLLDHVRHWSKGKEQVCLVTFNYDTMLEAALPLLGVEVHELPDYIASDTCKVIKLHGSVNWGREVDTPIEGLGERAQKVIVDELIDRAPDLQISQRYRMTGTRPMFRHDDAGLFPALAIPVERKRSFECPPEHLDALRTCIPEVSKILIIGWRATEYNFLDLLVNNLRKQVRVMVVAGGRNHADEISIKLADAGLKGDFLSTEGGFTDLIEKREIDYFLTG